MKKIFSTLLVCSFLFLFVGRAHAVVPSFQLGVVQGLISGPDENPLVGATVTVDCDSNLQSTTSDANGFYSVQFANVGCIAGEAVVVTAEKNGQSGTSNGVMQDAGTVGFLKLDIAVVHVPVVPEFGLVTGLLALSTSGASYFFLKRRFV